MEKILTHYIEPNSIVFNPNPFTKDDKNWDVVSYDSYCQTLWRISQPTMSVFDGINWIWSVFSTKDNFVSSISGLYPSDLEFFLFHPEALEGTLPSKNDEKIIVIQ